MVSAGASIAIVGLDRSHLPRLSEIVAANDPNIPHMMVADVSAWLDSGRPEGEAYFTALDPAGRPLGMTGYRPDPWGVADISWLVWLYVDPAQHRRGVARQLFTYAQDRLRDRGCRKVYLDVGNADTHGPAIAFHEQDGFVREGTLLDYWDDGEDFLIFSKRL